MGKHSAERRSPLPVALGTVAVIALVAAAIFVYRAATGSTDSSAATGLAGATSSITSTSTSSRPSSGTTSATPTTSSADAAARAALQGCVAKQQAAKPVVDAATTGARDWNEHVQGQTDIESGARSLVEVKTATWGPTRAAGPGEVAAYDAALNTYQGVHGCEGVGSLPAPADLKPKLEACAAHQQALDAYLETANGVIGDWRTHLTEMADHADGHINSVQAQASWIKRWREAPAHLDPYNAAAKTLAGAPACTA